MHHPRDRITHTTEFDIAVVDHWLKREIAQCVHHEGSIRRPISPRVNALNTELHLAPIYYSDVRSGQVRSECLACTFRASCCSARLSRAQDTLMQREGRKCRYLTTHSTHFIYGYMASNIWLRTFLIVRKETRCRHIGYSFRLTARVLLYAPSHRQDCTYHGLCYTSRGALAGTTDATSFLDNQLGDSNDDRLSRYIYRNKPSPFEWERDVAQR